MKWLFAFLVFLLLVPSVLALGVSGDTSVEALSTTVSSLKTTVTTVSSLKTTTTTESELPEPELPLPFLTEPPLENSDGLLSNIYLYFFITGFVIVLMFYFLIYKRKREIKL